MEGLALVPPISFFLKKKKIIPGICVGSRACLVILGTLKRTFDKAGLRTKGSSEPRRSAGLVIPDGSVARSPELRERVCGNSAGRGRRCRTVRVCPERNA